MDAIVLETMQSTYTPEYIDSILMLENVIVNAGDKRFEEAVTLIAAQVSNHEALDISDTVVNHLIDISIGFLEELEIEVNPDIPLDVLSKTIDALVKFDSSEDDEDILNILEVESDPKEVLIQLLLIKTDLDETTLFENVYNVSENQIRNLHDLVTSWLDDKDESDVDTYDEIDILSTVQSYLDMEDATLAKQAIDDEMPMGVGIESMLNRYGDYMLNMSLESVVTNLVGLHIMAGDNKDNIVEEVLESARCYTLDDDMTFEMNVRKQTNKLIGNLKW